MGRNGKIAMLGLLALFLFYLAFLSGCQQPVQTSDSRQANETRRRLDEADKQVGMPDITRFTERKLARDILELRDKEIVTYAYIVTLNGDLVYLGEAIGFGLPYSVQYTNPQQLVDARSYVNAWSGENHTGPEWVHAIPQADPNGLFMPDGLSATWIMLKGPDGEVHPVYVEPTVIVSPFKLHTERVRPNNGDQGQQETP